VIRSVGVEDLNLKVTSDPGLDGEFRPVEGPAGSSACGRLSAQVCEVGAVGVDGKDAGEMAIRCEGNPAFRGRPRRLLRTTGELSQGQKAKRACQPRQREALALRIAAIPHDVPSSMAA
jgi:hypothetical protein